MKISRIEPSSSFQPSLWTKSFVQLTAPSTLISCGVLGATRLMGGSWPLATAIAGTIFACTLIENSNTLKAALFIEADRISLGMISGGDTTTILPLVLKELTALQFNDAIVARNCLESILNYENHFNVLGINNQFLISDFIGKINQLKPGQKTGASFCWRKLTLPPTGHAILGSIERKDNGNFIVHFHNGGNGIEYHYKRVNPKIGITLYQTTLEIDEVTESNLQLFIKHIASFNAFGLHNDSWKIYEAIPLLNGNILPPSTDLRLWSRAQIGNSCSGYVIRCFLQTLLTPEDMEKFHLQFLSSTTEKLKKQIDRIDFFQAKPQQSERLYYYHVYEELRSKLIRLGGKDLGSIKNISQKDLLSLKEQKLVLNQEELDFYLKYFNYSPYPFKRIGKFEPFQELDIALEDIKKAWGKSAEKYLEAVQNFRKIFIKTYQSIDRKQCLDKNLTDLDRAASEIVQQKETSTTGLGSWHTGLNLLYKTIFPTLNYQVTDRGALIFLQVIDCLKQKKFQEARKHLETIYQMVEELSELSMDQAKDYEYAMICTLYLGIAVSFEDIELRAGMSIIFSNLQSKVAHPDKLKTSQELTLNNQKTNEIFNNTYKILYGTKEILDGAESLDSSLKEYYLLRLDKEFPKSPWKNSVVFEDYLPPHPGSGLESLISQQVIDTNQKKLNERIPQVRVS